MDRKERNKLVLKHIGLVHKVVNSLTIYMDYQDMLQEGTIGLIKAVETYNPKRCRQFSTYATVAIKSNIMRAYHNKGNFIRIPVHIQEYYTKLRKVKGFTDMELDATYDIEYLSEETKLPIQVINNTIEYCTRRQINIEPLSSVIPYKDDIDHRIDCKLALKQIERRVATCTQYQKDTYQKIFKEGEKSPNDNVDNCIYNLRCKFRKLFNGVPECLK